MGPEARAVLRSASPQTGSGRASPVPRESRRAIEAGTCVALHLTLQVDSRLRKVKKSSRPTRASVDMEQLSNELCNLGKPLRRSGLITSHS